MPNPVEVRFVSLNVTPEVGANDGLVFVYPNAGEELHFRPGSVEITIGDVDRMAKPGPDGYATISNTVWTWLIVGALTAPALFRFLVSASRRLDTAHTLYTQVNVTLGNFSGPYPHQREQAFAALGLSEVLCVSLSRAVDMLQKIPAQFSINLPLPATFTAQALALRDIRDAFEHIEERALGNVWRKPDADALSIVDQTDLLTRGVLTYASHSLDLRSEALPMLLDARRDAFETAVQVAGPAYVLNVPIVYR